MRLQVEKDVNKAIGVMEEVEVEIGRKKEVSWISQYPSSAFTIALLVPEQI